MYYLRRAVHPGRPIEYHEERRMYKASTSIVSILLGISYVFDDSSDRLTNVSWMFQSKLWYQLLTI